MIQNIIQKLDSIISVPRNDIKYYINNKNYLRFDVYSTCSQKLKLMYQAGFEWKENG